MKKRIIGTARVRFAALVIAAIILPTVFMGNGSKWLARRWMKRFAEVNTVSEAVEQYQVARREFSDGSWIFGVAVRSHGNPFGGTVVTKDSTGHTRVFFGHVCAGREVARAIHESRCSSLPQAFSNLVANSRFKEQELK